MLPITLNVEDIKIIVVGDGYMAENKVKALNHSGANNFTHYKTPPNIDVYKDSKLVFVCGFDNQISAQIANEVRETNKDILLNIEDKKQHCDFHMPALVRRGDLTIAISTSGKSPRIASRIRMMLENIFTTIWADRLNDISNKRDKWISNGDKYDQLIAKTDELVDPWFDDISIKGSKK